MKQIIILLVSLAATFTLTSPETTNPKDHPDYAEVVKAIENYRDALYLVQPEKIAASVDPSLRKVGYYRSPKDGSYRDNLPMSYDQLYELAGKWNSNGDQINDESPRAINIHEIHDKTASGKLTAAWGIDFFQLAKVEGEWKIMNIIWQSPPLN